MSPRLVYADSSALCKLFLAERESGPLAGFLADCEVVVTVAPARIEVHRALRRLGFGGEQAEAMRRLFRGLRLRAVTDDLIERAESVDPPALRALDALHLAAAFDLGPALEGFVCYDQHLAAAASHHGLTVFAPEADEIREP